MMINLQMMSSISNCPLTSGLVACDQAQRQNILRRIRISPLFTSFRTRQNGMKRSQGAASRDASSNERLSPNARASNNSLTPRTRAALGGRGRGRDQAPQQGQFLGQQQKSKYDMLIVVEGANDMRAVQRAVNADVYVLGTATRAGNVELQKELLSIAQRYNGVVLLLDPDVAGRQARNILTVALPNCWHAFIPLPVAQAAEAIRNKVAGDIGVEHASPQAILMALSRKRRSSPDRTEFTREFLQDMGLIAVVQEKGGRVTERRILVCNYIGLGTCDGKQLLRQLNTYGFEKKDLEAALAYADSQLQQSTPSL